MPCTALPWMVKSCPGGEFPVGAKVAALMDEILKSPWLDYVMLAVTLFTVWTGISYLVSNRSLILRNPAGGR